VTLLRTVHRMTLAPRHVRTTGLPWIVCAVATFASTEALAQVTDTELAARRTLIDQASAARAANNPQQALDLAQRAGRIQMTPSLRMFIAETLAAMGNHAEAMGAADRCAQEADRDATASNRAQILASCRAVATNARTHVGYVTVTARGAASPTIRINDTTLSEALVGVPFVVNEGAVRVRVTADGFASVSRELTVTAGSTVPVEIVMERSSTERVDSSTRNRNAQRPGGSDRAPRATGSTSGVARDTSGSRADAPTRGAPVGAVVLLASSAIPLGASLGFYFARNGALAGCAVYPTYVECASAQQASAAHGANTFAILSGVALGVGVATLVGGAVWLGVGLAARPRREQGSVAPIAFNIGNDGAGLGVAGRF